MDWITLIGPTITSGLTAVLGWFLGRGKYKAEVKGEEVKNFDSAIEAYKKLYENREEIYREQIKELKEENAALKKEMTELRAQVLTVSNFVTAYMVQGNTPNKDALTAFTNKTIDNE